MPKDISEIKKQTLRFAVVNLYEYSYFKIELSKLTIVWRYYNLKQQTTQAIFADEKFTSIVNF